MKMTFINPWDERFIYTIKFVLPEQPRKILTRTIIEKQFLKKRKKSLRIGSRSFRKPL